MPRARVVQFQPPGPPLQGAKAMTIAVLAKPECVEGKQGRGSGLDAVQPADCKPLSRISVHAVSND